MDPSRQRIFDLEFRWLESAESQAKEARIAWIEQLAKELKAKIPAFVAALDLEDSKKTADTEQ